MTRARDLATVAFVAIVAGAIAAAGCDSGRAPPAPSCMIGASAGGAALELECTARAVFCVDGPPDIMGRCPGSGAMEVREPFEPRPGWGSTCTSCVLTTGSRLDPALTCQNRMCLGCLHGTGSGRCISCEASVVSVGPADCPLESMGIPGGAVIGGGGVDAGPPGVDGGPPPTTGHHYAVTSFAYAGGTSLAGAPVADFEIEDALGVPTAISADELLWVGFEHGALRGFDIATHEVEIDLDLTSITGAATRVNNLQVYRSDGRLMAIVAFGNGVARIEIDEAAHSFLDRGYFDSNFTMDARIHVVEPLRDEGFVVAVSAIPSRLWVIPRIDATGAFPPRTRPLDDAFMPRVVASEAVADGFVWTGERNLCPRRDGDLACGHVGTFRTTCPSAGDPRCLEELASATFDAEPVMGLGGPDQVATTGSLLIVGFNQPTVGVIASFDPVTLDIRDSFNLEGPISTFTTRSAGAEVYAFATTTAGFRSAELLAVIPTAPSGLEPRARRTLSNAEVVHDIAIGVEASFPPPEPHEPIPLERTSAVVHLLVERP